MYIVYCQQKGGVGKTTLATNMAIAACQRGYRAALWDADTQEGAQDWYLEAQTKGDGRVATLRFEHLPNPLKLDEYERKAQGCDVVLVDGPPRLERTTRAIAALGDLIIIPIRPGKHDWNALEQTMEVLDFADLTRSKLSLPREPARRVFVINGAHAGTTVLRDLQEGLAKLTVAELSPIVIHQAPSALANKTGGESALLDFKGSSAAKEINMLADLYLPVPRDTSMVRGAGARA
jgi:chromosome partitioning protein